ncbi:MAG: c-type cytochrome [Saprospiraceae bacterium]|nr:c-type cytochrome [Saprospiraceae bacterium]
MFACSKKDARLAQIQVPELNFNLHYDGLLYLPEGWKSILWAESPMLYNPTNMDVDHRGRIWITEAVNYRDFNNDPKRFPYSDQGDRVMILQDTNGDGVADSSKVFVQDTDLVAPLGIAVLGNQVIISCAPNLIIYTDEDGDDQPDKKEIILTGFGGYDHDHSLHALIAGPDGKWYFNTGNAGPHTVTDRSGWTLRSGSLYVGGTPYNLENSGGRKSDDNRVWVGGLALRMNPDVTGLEVLAHNFRNAYELAVDSYGDLWQNDNDDQVETCRSTWLMYGGNAGYFSQDGTRYWQADRRPGQSIFTAHWHQEDPGVLPAGDNTGAGSPTGVLVYEGDEFGEQYRGMFLNVDAGRNAIFAYQPKLDGAGFELRRKDLIASLAESTEGYIWNQLPEDIRKWFRPSDMVVGTDGAFYIADWYDPVVGGHQMHDTLAYGRIYRVTPTTKKLETPEIDVSTTEGQIQALCNPAINVRNLGFKRLLDQGEKSIEPVSRLLQAENPFHRARAVWLLSQLGEKGQMLVEQVLETNPDPRLRTAAFRALVQANPSFHLDYAGKALTDPATAVWRAIAVSLRDIPEKDCEQIIISLYRNFDGEDPWYLEALGQAIEGKTSVYEKIRAEQPVDPTLWDAAFSRLTWRLHPESALDDLKVRALAPALGLKYQLEALTAIAFIPGQYAAETMITISENTNDPRVQKMADWWINFRKSNLWFNALDWEEEEENQEIPQEIINAEVRLLSERTPLAGKITAALELASHPDGGERLISLAASGALPAEMYNNNAISTALFNHPDQQTRILTGQFFSRDDGERLSISEIIELEGEPANGSQLFEIHCISCHKMGEKGREIGPDLKNIRRKFDKTALVDAILYPNAAVTFGYEPVMIRTKTDQLYSGFIVSEGKTTVIKDIEGTLHTLLPEQVQEKEILNNSLMPDPVAFGLKAQDIADIVAYLQERPTL